MYFPALSSLARRLLIGWRDINKRKSSTTMKITQNDAELRAELKKRYKFNPWRGNPDPERALTVENATTLKSVPEDQKEIITSVCLWFAAEIQECIVELRHFRNLKSLYFFDCYRSDVSGIDAYRGLSKLKHLESLRFRDSKIIDKETMAEIAAINSLKSLTFQMQPFSDSSLLEGLKECRGLEYLGLWEHGHDEIFVEDLAFISCLEHLRWLDLDGCDHIDITKLQVPKSLEVFTPPSYGYNIARKAFADRCVVLKTCLISGPMKNRFVSRKEKVAARAKVAQERMAARAAALVVSQAKRKIDVAIKTLRDNLPLFGCDEESINGMLSAAEQKILQLDCQEER